MGVVVHDLIVHVGTDSGSARSVKPERPCTVMFTELQQGLPVQDGGNKNDALHPHGGTLREAMFRVVAVSDELISVSDMVDAGHQVTVNDVGGIDPSRAARKGSGIPLELIRRNGGYEVAGEIQLF